MNFVPDRTTGYAKWHKILAEAAEKVYGQGTIAAVNCGDSDGKKLCKKNKVTPDPIALKHYHNGEFNKDYDRQETGASLTRFMMDPTGDTPWEEDPTGAAVRHIASAAEWKKFLKAEKQPILAMFYAPWCGFCKRMKPAYGEAAAELKGSKKLVAMDVTRPENAEIGKLYEVTGYPTIIYFENGKKKFLFGGENTKDGIVSWMKDPKPKAEAPKEVAWADEPSEVAHLTTATFKDFIATHPSVAVMFYAPWCGHCKTMKPEFTKAAATLKEEDQIGRLAAVDATVEKELGDEFGIKGFPTVKYFKGGEFAWDLTSERKADALLNFMRDPKEPPPPPPPELPWAEQETDVVHLTSETFKAELKRYKHALVMFYAPWCGHCKSAKPEFNEAAAELKDDEKVVFAAVDCTTEKEPCTDHGVASFPTLKYFSYAKNPEPYSSGRKKAAFVDFMKGKSGGDAPAAAPPAQKPESTDEWTMEGGEKVLQLGADNFEAELKDTKLALVMFYAPWCGHCKRAKPFFAEAAQKTKAGHALAAVDCTVHKELCSSKGVRGYPTLKMFKAGVEDGDYNGERTADAFLAAANGDPPPTPKPTEKPKEVKVDKWTDPGSEFVLMLTADNFEQTMSSAKNALVMFYAPWCGHCKKAKPAFSEAASDGLKDGNGMMAMDCTVHKETCQAHGVQGYPTLQVWKDGKFASKYSGARTVEAFRAAANGEAAPPAPKPAEDKWDNMEGGNLVKQLSAANFASELKPAKRALVMFYAPWCGHCKRAKPDFSLAAKEAPAGTVLAAVDCTVHKDICSEKGIRGYPTLQIFAGGEFVDKYAGPRDKAGFLAALTAPAVEEKKTEL